MELTRWKLINQDDWTKWNESEHLQLDQYDKQFMFGNPVLADNKSAIFPSFGHMLLKNLTDARRLVVFVTDLPIPDRYESLTTHMPIVWTEWAHRYSMPYLQLRIC
jgi:hypothetical protein